MGRLNWLLALLLPMPLLASSGLFDSHLHYDLDDASRFTPAQIVAKLRANGVSGAVVTGSPPQQAATLYRTAPELVIPLLGVYRDAGDKQRWTEDPALPQRVADQLEQGYWAGIGELHLFADRRHSPVFLRIVELAATRRLPLLMHCDPVVIDSLFDHRPDALVVWAHAGAYPYPPLLRDYLERYPGLHIDLSVRDERIAPDGMLDDEWALLLTEYPDRFMVGVDTYRTERWANYDEVAGRIRGWLSQLPDEVALGIARENGERVYRQDRPAQTPSQASTP